MEKEDIVIKELLINDLFLEYVFAYSESSDKLNLYDSLYSLAPREKLIEARDFVLNKNGCADTLSNEEIDLLKKRIISTLFKKSK